MCVFRPAIVTKLRIFAYFLFLSRPVQQKEAKMNKVWLRPKKKKLAHAGYHSQQAQACPSYPSHVTYLHSFYSHDLVIENSAFSENIKRLEPRLYKGNIFLLLHAFLSREAIFPARSSASLSKHHLYVRVCLCSVVRTRTFR